MPCVFFSRRAQYPTLPRSSIVTKKLSSIEKGNAISRGTIIQREGQIDVFSSGSEAESASTLRKQSLYASLSRNINYSLPGPSDRSKRIGQTLRPNTFRSRDVSSDNEFLNKRSVILSVKTKASTKEQEHDPHPEKVDLISMSDSELGRHLKTS